MKVPILGWLFKNQEIISKRNELLIFITPTIIPRRKRSLKDSPGRKKGTHRVPFFCGQYPS